MQNYIIKVVNINTILQVKLIDGEPYKSDHKTLKFWILSESGNCTKDLFKPQRRKVNN